MSSNRFDDILGAAGKEAGNDQVKTEVKPKKPQAQPKQPSGPWENLEPPKREPTIRLNVDIPISLNDKLTNKARTLRKPKTELVRRLLEWALDESFE